jgi:hypothetical protein
MDLNNLLKEIPYQWRVQSFGPNSASCVAYIDSRDVQVMLDKEVGPENWECDYKEIKGNLFCGIGIRINDRLVWKWDCGTESNTEKEKGEASDAFKRAAVKWGIGRFLYDLEIKRIKFTEKNGKKYPIDTNGNILWSGADLTKFLMGGKVIDPEVNGPDQGEKKLLIDLVYSSDLSGDEREKAFEAIETCENYEKYQKIQHKLESRQKSLDEIQNPSQGDIKKHLRKAVKA